jgi:DNA-binding HxlR family transcriptional regulator
MTLSRGVLEMIKLSDATHPKSFSDFTHITIKKKRLSSATVSKRLNELVAIKVLDEVPMRSETGRRIIGYRITERGKKILELAKELDDVISHKK